jgi:hypothetical protein
MYEDSRLCAHAGLHVWHTCGERAQGARFGTCRQWSSCHARLERLAQTLEDLARAREPLIHRQDAVVRQRHLPRQGPLAPAAHAHSHQPRVALCLGGSARTTGLKKHLPFLTSYFMLGSAMADSPARGAVMSRPCTS